MSDWRDIRDGLLDGQRKAKRNALAKAVDFIDEVIVDTGGIGSIVASDLRDAGFKVTAKMKRRAP